MKLDRMETKVVDECERYLRKKKEDAKGWSEQKVLSMSLGHLKQDAEKIYLRNGVTEKVHAKILKVEAVLNIVTKKAFGG
jgi:hypothetical protein